MPSELDDLAPYLAIARAEAEAAAEAKIFVRAEELRAADEAKRQQRDGKIIIDLVRPRPPQ
jgi:hypothetical protein